MSYWHLIVPPIILAFSLGFLAWLFMKKKSTEKGSSSQSSFTSQSFLGTKGERSIRRKMVVDRLESIVMGFFDLVWKKLLKFFGWLFTQVGNFIQHLRKKRKQSLPQRKKMDEVLRESHRKQDVKSHRQKEFFSEEQARIPQDRPMVSQEVAQPSKKEMNISREKYEEILIERIALNPRDMNAYEQLGDYYMNGRNFQDAKECYKQVLKFSPGNHSTKTKIRRLERILAKNQEIR